MALVGQARAEGIKILDICVLSNADSELLRFVDVLVVACEERYQWTVCLLVMLLGPLFLTATTGIALLFAQLALYALVSVKLNSIPVMDSGILLRASLATEVMNVASIDAQ